MNKHKVYTMKEIAAIAGVSVATVSNALTGNRHVKEKTKEKINKIVKEVNYTTNLIASGLKTKKTKTIAVIIPHIANPVYAQYIEAIEEIAQESSYEAIIVFSYYDVLDEKKYTKDLIARSIDGFIFVGGFDNYEYIKDLFKNKIKLVILDRDLEDEKIPSVKIDNFAAMKNATDYLCKLGHKRICYITYSFENLKTVEKRFEGYCAGLKENNIKFDSKIVIIDNKLLMNELDNQYLKLQKIFDSNKSPTAILTASDYISIGVIKVLKNMNIRIPDDVSVMGYDNIIMGRHIEPKLTTISQSVKSMGQNAMKMLVNILEEKRIENKNLIFSSELKIRESTGKPRKLISLKFSQKD